MFPSGSVTGAPKHSAMEIIRSWSTPRGIYTGAIGYLSPHGRVHFNVAIRTASIDREHEIAEFGVGSGIVWDSVDRDEYDECLIKAEMADRHEQPRRMRRMRSAAFVPGEHPDFRLLETIRWEPGTGFRLLDRHLARLWASAECFGFPATSGTLAMLLDETGGDLKRPSRSACSSTGTAASSARRWTSSRRRTGRCWRRWRRSRSIRLTCSSSTRPRAARSLRARARESAGRRRRPPLEHGRRGHRGNRLQRRRRPRRPAQPRPSTAGSCPERCVPDAGNRRNHRAGHHRRRTFGAAADG